MKNTNSIRFTLDFVNKAIVGTKASFDKASKGYGPIYEELAEKMAKHPDFTVKIKAPKTPAKPKQTYAGMDIPFMRDFLIAMGDSITLKTLDDAIAYAKKMGMSKYPLAKRVFFDTYDCFDFADAKLKVDEYRHQLTLKNANEFALTLMKAKNDNASNEPELKNVVNL